MVKNNVTTHGGVIYPPLQLYGPPALPGCREETWGWEDKDSYQSQCRCLEERGHNRIPKLLLASRISFYVKRVREEVQRDGWVEVGMGVVCVV